MKLKVLLKDLNEIIVKGSREVEISGITSHSKYVAPGNIFVARRGLTYDGTRYIPEAIRAGASCIVSDLYDPTLQNITQLIYSDVKLAEAKLASAYYGFPSEKLWVVGVTGTNGKTTATYGIKHVLDSCGETSGMLGTIHYSAGKATYASPLTTPDVCTVHRLLADMARHGCTSCSMEVTSHALDQGRVEGVEYDVCVFTNLTHEHLDYHQTMEAYAQAKSLLFSSLGKGSSKAYKKLAVVNADDPWTSTIIKECSCSTITYGIEKEADLSAKDITFTQEGTSFTLVWQKETTSFSWPLVGRFNVYNALAIIGALLAKGMQLRKILDVLGSFGSVPGRLERVANPLGIHIFVDYAHKPDALENVLRTLKECCEGKIITVFGCGGDRDKEKRPKMARIAEALSDVVIVTTDNPRTEDPHIICNEVVGGFSRSGYIVDLDRKEAIKKAIGCAMPGDLVLIAGKGHETKQYFAHKTVDFDDREVAHTVCQERILSGKG